MLGREEEEIEDEEVLERNATVARVIEQGSMGVNSMKSVANLGEDEEIRKESDSNLEIEPDMREGVLANQSIIDLGDPNLEMEDISMMEGSGV